MECGGAHEAALERGRNGEIYLLEFLEEHLAGSGLVVHHASENDAQAPFDIEVLDQDRILVAIENKDLAENSKGTWIIKSAKRRKEKYAIEHGIKKILTTVTKRDGEGYIGFQPGIVNGHVTVFNFRAEELVKEILSARMEA